MPRNCPSCSKVYGDDFSFCPYCGTPAPQMVNCPTCGLEFKEDHAFCPRCGTPKGEQVAHLPFCPRCGNPFEEGYAFCPHCGNAAIDAEEIVPARKEADSSGKASGWYYHTGSDGNMGWYKFIIYFQLFAAAVICFINALSVFASEEIVYLSERIDEFETLMIFYSIAMLCLGIDALITRWSLANFKYYGPRLYVSYLLANAAVTLIYLLWMNGILEDYRVEIDNTFAIVGLITNAAMALLNWIYFDNRKGLFVN